MTFHTATKPLGRWRPEDRPPEPIESALREALLRTTRPVFVVEHPPGRLAVSQEGTAQIGGGAVDTAGGMPLRAVAPPLHPRELGDGDFKRLHGLRYAYVVGEMANGITSVRMVCEAGKAGMLGFFGAGGLAPQAVAEAVESLQGQTPPIPFGVNLIHSPGNPELEMALVELFLRKGVRLVSASAFLDLTLPLVYYRVKGLHRDPSGRIICPNRVVAKVSRVEVARKFLEPPPEKLLTLLAGRGLISAAEAELAAGVPVACDLTAEADSGGHTDNRPAITLLPTMIALRDEIAAKNGYDRPPCVGLGGGIAGPESAAAAFALGAAYVLTGSINQACVEAGTSQAVCVMLSEAGQADVAMAPAADMFELGVKVQVLKRGTMFPQRAARLYEFYAAYPAYEQIPARQREILERDFFRRSFEEEWQLTRRFFLERDPRQVERAEQDPKQKMALVFRSYLGLSSLWAISGDPDRRIDYQIWCGPAIGAFNQWTKGSFLEQPENRQVAAVAMNLLFGAAVATRAGWLRAQGIPIPREAAATRPMPPAEITALLEAP
jgi:PfaD family protein